MATVKTGVRRCFEDIVCKGDFADADELISDDLVFTTASGAVLKRRREFQRFAQQFRNAFPNISCEIQDEIQEDTTTRFPQDWVHNH